MFIKTESTPNPLSYKFILPNVINNGPAIEISKTDNTDFCPMAKDILKVKEIEGVFILDNFITITKGESATWDQLKAIVIGIMLEYLASKKPLLLKKMGGEENKTIDKKEQSNLKTEIINEINALLDERIKPFVAKDGGDVKMVDFKDGIVFMKLKGACKSCPSASVTLKMGIERLLKFYIPEVKEVREHIEDQMKPS